MSLYSVGYALSNFREEGRDRREERGDGRADTGGRDLLSRPPVPGIAGRQSYGSVRSSSIAKRPLRIEEVLSVVGGVSAPSGGNLIFGAITIHPETRSLRRASANSSPSARDAAPSNAANGVHTDSSETPGPAAEDETATQAGNIRTDHRPDATFFSPDFPDRQLSYIERRTSCSVYKRPLMHHNSIIL
jgi:hypothetical protein